MEYTGAGDLTGKKALITCEDFGIGRAVAKRFAREGAGVRRERRQGDEEDGQSCG